MENIDKCSDLDELKNIARTNYADDALKLKCYEKCYQLGDLTVIANIASTYEFMKKRKRDDETAIEWYQLGITLNQVDCMVGLADLYRRAGDDAQAFKLYQEAKKQGSALAYEQLSVMYFKGQHVEPNLGKAIKYYLKCGRDWYMSPDLIIRGTGEVKILQYIHELQTKVKEQEKLITKLRFRPPELGGPEYEKAKMEFATLVSGN